VRSLARRSLISSMFTPRLRVAVSLLVLAASHCPLDIDSNPVYLCDYGVDCIIANRTAVLCCRDPARPFADAVFTCRVRCE